MVMECKYGGGLFLEFQPLTGCMVCDGVGHPYCRFTTVCEGWMVFVLTGALIMFLAGLFSWVLFQSRVWMLVWLCALSCCMFTMSLCCVFISLCGDAFVYGSVILTFVLGAPNLCGRCSMYWQHCTLAYHCQASRSLSGLQI